jgi:hypothetical protein
MLSFQEECLCLLLVDTVEKLGGSARRVPPAAFLMMSLPKTPSPLAVISESEHDGRVIAIATLFVRLLFDFFKPRQRLEAEILVLRH